MSSLEQVIYKILVQANIRFEREKQFKDCYNGLYRFDFYCPDLNIIIEVHGAQHYKFTNFFKNRSEFLKSQERDRRKISYCLSKGIKLYCIPYWDIDTIKTFDDITQEKFLAITKFHNDEAYRLQNSKTSN